MKWKMSSKKKKNYKKFGIVFGSNTALDKKKIPLIKLFPEARKPGCIRRNT